MDRYDAMRLRAAHHELDICRVSFLRAVIVIGDKGYDSNANRLAARQRGIAPVIPYKSNARIRPAFFPKALYKARPGIEQAVGPGSTNAAPIPCAAVQDNSAFDLSLRRKVSLCQSRQNFNDTRRADATVRSSIPPC
jgi:hypothetical protein